MKNKFKLFGITALIAVMVFAMTACDNGSQGVAPAITTTALPNGEVGTAYSQTLTATGDTPITWTINTGSLPDGLELSEAGEIAGNPTTAGTFNFTVKAENATGNDTQALSIFIAPEGGGDIIINIAAIAGVTAPVQGAAPVTAITANDQYTGTVTWSGNPTAFAYDTVYTATITLTAKTGYTLTGVTANFFTVAGTSTPATNAANSGVITAIFPQTEEDTSLLHLSGNVTISPNSNVYTGTELTATYTGGETVSYQWKKDDSNVGANSNKFTPTAAGSYTVTVSATGYNSKTSDAVTVIQAFTDIATLAEYLDELPDNDWDTSYTIKLNVTDLSGVSAAIIDSGKYVSLDLSDSTLSDIPSEAFLECSNLTSIIIPDGVTSIGDMSFEDCSNLRSITIPEGVTSIGYRAFLNCRFTSVIIPDSVISIGYMSFEDCTNLTSVTIPNGVTSIELNTFRGCSSLASIIIPNSVISIGQSAFQGCASLVSIIIPNGVTSIEMKTFSDCHNLTSVTIPDSITSIGTYAFMNCSNLTSIIIPDGIISIGDGVFVDCSSLTSITIPSSVTSIGNAFTRCNSLTSIVVDENNTAYSSEDGILFNKAKTTLVQYPAGKTNSSYSIPNSVTNIGYVAFIYCSRLESATIPINITNIGTYAFYGCENIISVTFEGIIAEADFSEENVFYGNLRDKYLAVEGGPGTYTTTAPVSTESVWTKEE